MSTSKQQTVRELLQLAARAAGIKLLFDPDGLPRDCTGMEPAMNILSTKIWNPLDNDGDALRLAVDAGIDLYQAQLDFYNKHCSDDYAATRYAITCAAAEIKRGKT
jgi:hypothetical protein